MPTQSGLPADYWTRPATLDDAEAVAAILTACERAHGLGTSTSAATVLDDWQGVDLDEETLLIIAPDGSVAACADVLNRSYVNISVYGYVHPDHTGRGLGGYLVQWGEEWARSRMDRAEPGARVVVQHYVPSQDKAALELLPAHGYEPVRGTYVMGIELDAAPPEPEWPEGIHVTPYRPGEDDMEVHLAVEDAFRDLWGRPRSDFERFQAYAQGEGVRPDLWIIARDEAGQIAGISLGTLADDHGWIDTVGVTRAWRRKGLGLALLHASFRAFFRRGIHDVRLSVDAQSLTGANRLYERAGMHVISHYILHQKELRSGFDLSDRSGE